MHWLLISLIISLCAPAMAQTVSSGKSGRALEPDISQQGASEEAPLDRNRFGHIQDDAYAAFQRGYYLKALELARPRADAGDAVAQTLMAEIYANGFGVAPNNQEAARLYGLAAETGNPDAQLQYALMLFEGAYVEKNNDKAFMFMRKAAEAGKPLAQFNLAQALTEIGKNNEAMQWYEKAANAKLPDAQYAMALIYMQGIGGVRPDPAIARDWLQQAARQNYDTALLDLGTWLVEGRGGDVNYEEGFKWLKRAADMGNVAALNRVAKLYRAGIGVESDSVEAAAHYMRARRAGLVDNNMEEFLDGLTDDQLRAAGKRTESLR